MFGHPPRDQDVQPAFSPPDTKPTVRADMVAGFKESRDR